MRRLYVICLLVGIVVLSGIAAIVCIPRDLQPVIIYKPQFADAPKRTEIQINTHAEPRASEARALREQQTRLTAETVTEKLDPLEAALASPSYREYSEKQAERVGFNVLLWWEFLEANGIAHNGRKRQAEMFEKYFPDGGTYADYEPMMLLTVAEMFFEDPDASVMEVLHRFNATQSNRVWRFGYFNGYEGEYEWGADIQRAVADIVAGDTHTQRRLEPIPPSVSQLPTDTERSKTDGDASVNSPEWIPRTPTEMPTAEMTPLPESLEALETHFFEIEDAALTTDAEIEALLRKLFSPELSVHPPLKPKRAPSIPKRFPETP